MMITALFILSMLGSTSDYLRSEYPLGGDGAYRHTCARDGVPVSCVEAYDYRADMAALCQEADESCAKEVQ